MNRFASHPDERRQSHRLAIHDHARVKMMLNADGLGEDRLEGVTLTDISRDGLMASDAGQLLPGAHVLLEVPLIGWREAEVMWIAENRAGCRFEQPLSLEELRQAAASSERLAGEFPAFAAAIAGLHVVEFVAAARVEARDRDSGRPWLRGVLLVGALALVSFLITMTLLDLFDL